MCTQYFLYLFKAGLAKGLLYSPNNINTLGLSSPCQITTKQMMFHQRQHNLLS